MKRSIVSILAILLFSLGVSAQCFTPVWTEPSIDSMLIYVSLASLNGSNLQVGDEIGVFDGDQCVGAGTLTQELSGAPVYLVIETSRQFFIWRGFTPGNTISYRFCTGGEVANPTVVPTYITNGPTFVANDSCVVELRAVNAAPGITSIPDTVATEDILYADTIRAVDLDGDSLIYSAPLLPLWLNFNDTTHILSGIPGNPDVGYDTVTLRVFDGIVSVDTTFRIRVDNANDTLSITSVPDTVATEDLFYADSISARDIDVGDSLIYSALLLPPWLSFNDTTHILSGTPGNPDVGYDTVSLRVSDGTVAVDTTFRIRVDNVNDTLTITAVPDTLATEDVLYRDSINAVDIDLGDSLIFSALRLPGWLSFNDTTHVLSGIPGNPDVGYDTVILRVFDGTVAVDTTFIMEVINVNDAPVIASVSDTLALEDTLFVCTISAMDIDLGDTLSIWAPLLPPWLTFIDTTNTLRGTPGNDDVGVHAITVRISDGTVQVDSSFSIHVLNVNDDPEFTSVQDTFVLQGALYSYTATAEDIDGDTLVFSAPVLPVWLSFDSISHELSGIPNNDHVGDHQVVLRIYDGTVNVLQDYVIEVENVNDPPSVLSDPVTEARPGVAYSYTITAEDIDGDPLEYSALVLPGWLSFDVSTHTLSATPGEQDIGDQYVTVRVSDGSLYTDHTFVITVDDGNHAPTFTSDPATSATVGEAYIYTIVASDIDGDPLEYSAPQLPDWLSFNAETRVISGVPGSEDLGRHDVSLSVSDGTVTSDQNFSIYVENVNTPPSFISTPLRSIKAGELYVYEAEAEDADDDELFYWALSLPGWLSFNPDTRILHGIPTNDNAGDHNVSLRVSDGQETEDQNFIISVDFVDGIKELSAEDGIRIYPNPSDGKFFVEFSRELEKEVHLHIMDPVGRILHQMQFPPYSLILVEIQLNQYYPGLYFIQIYDDSFQLTRKLIMN